MSDIHFQRTYSLGDDYEHTKIRAENKLGQYVEDSELYQFNDVDKSITYTTEKLVPIHTTNRPSVMLLFSNPHPHSILQGMFLSPNTRGQESLFWSTMREAGLLQFSEEINTPQQITNNFLRADYESPFELVFNCYYAFPTNYPQDIKVIFGETYFNQIIKPESMNEFRETVINTGVEAVVTFNKEIFNLVTDTKVEDYLARLKAGELVQGQVAGISRQIPIYSTFPTGWIYHKNYKEMRRDNLVKIKETICGYLSLL